MNSKISQILDELITRYPILNSCRESISTAAEIMIECYRHDGMVFTCGNGGSASDADHIVGELVKGFTKKRPLPQRDIDRLQANSDSAYLINKLQCGFRALNLMSQSAINTAVQNDLDPSGGAAQQLYAMGRPGDVLIGISTSGNARNVELACHVAKIRDIKIIGLSGKTGGKLAQNADANICVPSQETYQIQELHLPIYHALCRMVEESFFEI